MENYRYILVFFCMLSVLSTQVIALKFDLSTVSNAVWEIIRYYQVNSFFFLKQMGYSKKIIEILFQNLFSS